MRLKSRQSFYITKNKSKQKVILVSCSSLSRPHKLTDLSGYSSNRFSIQTKKKYRKMSSRT